MCVGGGGGGCFLLRRSQQEIIKLVSFCINGRKRTCIYFFLSFTFVVYKHSSCHFNICRKLLDNEEVGKVMKVLEISDIRKHEYGVSETDMLSTCMCALHLMGNDYVSLSFSSLVRINF